MATTKNLTALPIREGAIAINLSRSNALAIVIALVVLVFSIVSIIVGGWPLVVLGALGSAASILTIVLPFVGFDLQRILRRLRSSPGEDLEAESRRKTADDARSLAVRMNEWLTNRQLDDPIRNAPDEAIVDPNHPEHERVMGSYDTHIEETIRQYKRDFLPEVVEARGALAEHGVIDSAFDRIYTDPKRYDDIKTIFEQLFDMAGRLRRK